MPHDLHNSYLAQIDSFFEKAPKSIVFALISVGGMCHSWPFDCPLFCDRRSKIVKLYALLGVTARLGILRDRVLRNPDTSDMARSQLHIQPMNPQWESF